MNIKDFELERWFARYEHEAEIMLSESGIRSLDAGRFDLDVGKMGYVIPTNGDPDLRDEVAGRYGRGGDEILFTCGTQEANFLTFITLLDKEDHVIVITPTYQALHSVPEAFADVTRIALQPPEWTLSIEKVKEAVQDNTKLIVLNNPNNPTGRYHSLNKVKALLDIAEDNGSYLLCDEVYRLLVEDPLPPVAKISHRGISTTSLTKAYGIAGARFGWVCGPKEVVDKAWRWKDYTTISPTKIGQHIAEQALGDMEDEVLKENRDLAEKNRAIVQEFIHRNGLDWYNPVGVNGFITVPDGFDNSVEFCRGFVKEYGVVLAPGKVFGFDDYFRIGFGLPTSELKEGLSRLEKYISSKV
ncbi:MAG: aminotransferase class I/II-fold pyridoxal phosphate-dependent enzyme [Candidatus Saliniplasma sp.]